MDISIVEYIIIALGTTRITSIIVSESIFATVRDRIFLHYPPEDNEAKGFYYQGLKRATSAELESAKNWSIPEYQKKWSGSDTLRKPHFIGVLLSCYMCLSVWVAFFNILVYSVDNDLAILVNSVFAVSQIAVILISKYQRL